VIRELALGIVLLLFFKPIIGPIVYAAVFAVALYPVYLRHKRKWFAAFLVFTSIIFLVFTGYLIVVNLFDQIEWMSELYNKLSPEEQVQVAQFSSNIPIADYALNIVRAIPSAAVGLVLFVAFFYFFLVDGHKLKKVAYSFLPRESAAQFVSEGWRNLRSIVGGVFVAMFVYIIFSTAVLYFTNSPSPLVLSVVAAIFGVLPVFAAWMVYAYPIYLHLTVGNYLAALVLVGFQLLWNAVVDFWFKAKYRGNLHPAVLLGSMIAGIYYFGFPGILVGPLLFTGIKTIASITPHRVEPVEVVSEDIM
jgi:predicted PurR-regulated permease PerM